jgi:hypothetical protein
MPDDGNIRLALAEEGMGEGYTSPHNIPKQLFYGRPEPSLENPIVPRM